MSGISDLGQLLRTMEPQLADEAYLFLHTTQGEPTNQREIFALINEAEGATIIRPLQPSDDEAEPRWARITLLVHSALAAVGLTAAVSTALAAAQISANMVAGYYHDHLFVPWERRAEALAILQQLQQAALEREPPSR